ncbi:MAG: hypothetical protein A4E40_00374 [Methanoregulaceae archaeon PtaU1.Bin059]|nr:MAG: hypothetical protein A4E40_00374 [Methanoregulaceae archaeon PtaU1.Bin059]
MTDWGKNIKRMRKRRNALFGMGGQDAEYFMEDLSF